MSIPSRIPPIPARASESEKTAPTTEKRKVEKVEKVEETDSEARARKFRQFVEEEEGENDTKKTPFFPTPFSLISERTGFGVGLEELTPNTLEKSGGAISSPEYSPPPATYLNATMPAESKAESPLPNSTQFWKTIDEPPQPSLPQAKMEERRSPFKTPATATRHNEKMGGRKSPSTAPSLPSGVKDITTTPLPAAAIPQATQATTAAEPYLGPEALSMYFYMVGMISVMVKPNGDSRTEFVLNSPSFANSKFFGSTIALERFSTAPYQVNIRLTGSNEAVQAFNQNIPNLLAAFQNGKFSYSIKRIDAVYESPLVPGIEKVEGIEGDMER